MYTYSNVAYNWMYNLQVEDNVRLQLLKGYAGSTWAGSGLYVGTNDWVHFNGRLVLKNE